MTEIEEQQRINYIKHEMKSIRGSFMSSYMAHARLAYTSYVKRYNNLSKEYKDLTGTDKYGYIPDYCDFLDEMDGDTFSCDVSFA